MRLSDFNLQVINVEKDPNDFTITINKNFVTFSKSLVYEFDYPSHILIAFDTTKRVMGLQVCRAKTKGSFLFSKPETKQKGVVKIMHKGLRNDLFEMMPEWEEGRRYRLSGISIPEDKAIIFELEQYEPLADYRKG
jgi:hypothetical protein